MARLTVTVDGGKEIEERFDRFIHNTGETRALMAEVGAALDEYNKKNWGRGAKDAPTTDQRWPDHGKLVNAAAAESRELPELKDTFRVKEITETSVTYGTDDYRAHFLQYGTKKMLKKPVLKLPRKAIRELIKRRILGGL